ncbi:hypothetical protein BKP42_44650 [Rhodococcus erythropolis]|nr:hypothetical protein BKP42_44650 [Rhodococcus erythropolis]
MSKLWTLTRTTSTVIASRNIGAKTDMNGTTRLRLGLGVGSSRVLSNPVQLENRCVHIDLGHVSLTDWLNLDAGWRATWCQVVVGCAKMRAAAPVGRSSPSYKDNP